MRRECRREENSTSVIGVPLLRSADPETLIATVAPAVQKILAG